MNSDPSARIGQESANKHVATTHPSVSGDECDVAETPLQHLVPELLAPAGNWDCAQAAIENGANAVYFGLQAGFNARARANNFTVEELPQLLQQLHRRGVKGYVTLNTLVFTDELPRLEETVRWIAQSQVDAVLVQDIGAARLIRQITPDLPIHASTQMTMTCAETIEVAKELDLERVVLARELSIAEIKKIAAATNVPLEVFVHGALCVAYSGQCLTSESLGGRSANRGQCAQACRLDYQLFVDDQPKDLGPVRYLLSPQDLAAIEMIDELIRAGVCSLKIEGRLKTPEYVANVVRQYRQAIDRSHETLRLDASNPLQLDASQRRELEMSFSRGLTPGWLEGNDHKRLVPGLSSSKRGVYLGQVVAFQRETLTIESQHPLKPGDGIVLDGDRTAGNEIGGHIYEVFQDGKKTAQSRPGVVDLRLQHGLLRNVEITTGQRVWQTSDPALEKELRRSFSSSRPIRKLPIDVALRIECGQPIEVRASVERSSHHKALAIAFRLQHHPEVARKHAVTIETLRTQFSRLGESAFELRDLNAKIVGTPMVPLSILGSARRQLVDALQNELDAEIQYQIAPDARCDVELARCKRAMESAAHSITQNTALSGEREAEQLRLAVLCRSLKQLQQVLETGGNLVYADFHDVRQHRKAVELAKSFGATIYLASLRIFKPGESGLLRQLAKYSPDGLLVRNLAAMQFAKQHSIPFVVDFSLNITNPLTAEWFVDHGATRVTPSYDLNRDQMLELVDATPAELLEVVVHQHMPMFHMEHCVFCSLISPGTNKTNCGRPCDDHDVELQDRIGVKHTLHADIGCRNTLYNGVAQSGAEAVPFLLDRGVKHFRIELLNDCPDQEVIKLVQLYRSLIERSISGADVWKQLKADNRLGVTRGTMEQPRNPLAIL